MKQGQKVPEDAQIGNSGTSGNAAGLAPDQEHVHFAVTDKEGNRIDPEAWLNDPSAAPSAHNQGVPTVAPPAPTDTVTGETATKHNDMVPPA